MSDNTASNKRIVKNTTFLYIRMILILVVSLYTSRVVLRTLGVVDFGVYNVVAGFVSMFAFMNITLANGIQRYYNYALGKQEQGGVKKVYITALTIQLLIAVILLVLLETVGLWYMNHKMVIPEDRFIAAQWVFQFSIASMIIVMMQIPYTAAIIAYERMNYYAIVGIVDVLLKLGIVFILPLLPVDKLQLYGLLMLFVSIVDFALYYGYSKKNVPELKLERFFDKELFNSMLGFSGWNIFGTFAFMMKEQGLNLLLNSFFGPIVNAARGIAAQIMSGMQGFSANILVAFRPQLIQSYAAEDYDRVKTIFFSESKLSYLMLLMLITPVVIELDFILNIWLGADMVPDYTKPFTVLILLNMLVSAFHQPLTHIIHATGKQKTFQLINAIVICSIIPVSWLFLKMGFNPNSVLVVSLVITAINVLVSVVITRRQFSFSIYKYFKAVTLPCLLATVIIPILPFAVSNFMNPGFLRLLIVLVAEAIVSAPIIYYVVLNINERVMIKSFVNKIIRK